jgi:signal transduction histidine kinase
MTVLALTGTCSVAESVTGDPRAPVAMSAVIALYTVASTTDRPTTWRVGLLTMTVLTGAAMLAGPLPWYAQENLAIFAWTGIGATAGDAVRSRRAVVRAIRERAERAERTREEEARRRVAEERLRIARDLHDLLAHSITLIGVQTSVAAHVLTADPDRLDRTAVAKALDDIAETCRSARGELRTTLEVLRDPGGPEARGPLPGLHGLSDLADTARAAGARVDLSVRGEDVPPAVGAAVYRIVQEALTNAVRHGGRDDLNVRVAVHDDAGALRVTVTDDGSGTGAGVPGFGLVGMRERARSIGGVLEAGPREGKGFEVSAVLPLGQPATREQSMGEQHMREHR